MNKASSKTSNVLTSILACLVAACASEVDKAAPEESPVKILANVDYVIPAESVTDWVSYGDQVSVVTVTEEIALPVRAEVLAHREGYIGRRVTLRIEETIWSNAGVTPVKGDLEIGVFGWILKENARIPMGPLNAARLRAGGRYILPLTRFEDSWNVLTSDSVLAAPESAIATKDVDENGQGPVATEFAGRSTQEIKRALELAPRNALAERHRELSPTQRWEAVKADMRASEPQPVLESASVDVTSE